ncbi:hypothetical protein [Planctobacterium marinum]|uniref:hypothetical protein n=1 Tax=Planctobacterium marinum TaxID=1631968 RepID=UPI0030C6D46E
MKTFPNSDSALLYITGYAVIVIDGKTAWQSVQTRERSNPLYAISVRSCLYQPVLGQVAVS